MKNGTKTTDIVDKDESSTEASRMSIKTCSGNSREDRSNRRTWRCSAFSRSPRELKKKSAAKESRLLCACGHDALEIYAKLQLLLQQYDPKCCL